MYIINPDPYLLPDYKISPFSTDYVGLNNQLEPDCSIDEYFENRFTNRDYVYTINGRSALNLALSNFSFTKEDLVTIFTTSGNSYISACVTSEIEKFCKWNREVTSNTKLIVVIHEFGYPYPELDKLKEYNLPIIEDSAYAFFSQNQKGTVGNIGDFVIYSFPKIFPIQIGGLLVSKKEYKYNKDLLSLQLLTYLKKVLSSQISKEHEICTKRLENYSILERTLKDFDFNPRFKLNEGVIPGVYIFKKEGDYYPELKTFMYKHGIQCSVFYGEGAFFIPVHQNLSKLDLNYFKFVVESFFRAS